MLTWYKTDSAENCLTLTTALSKNMTATYCDDFAMLANRKPRVSKSCSYGLSLIHI